MEIKNVGILKWMKAEIDAGRSEQLEAKIEEVLCQQFSNISVLLYA